MKNIAIIASAIALTACSVTMTGQDGAPGLAGKSAAPDNISAITYEASCPAGASWSFAIHGGAGVITKARFTDEQEAGYRADLGQVVQAGSDMLERGMSALDAAQHMVTLMEDNPKFNAGHGAVFSAAGINELDASIMDGRNRDAGAVSSVTTVRNPILAARAVLDNSRHVLLSGQGAEDFAAAQGLTLVPNSYFGTDRRRKQLDAKLAKKTAHYERDQTRFGTVGAVVKDGCGNLAAATSTGGLTAKEFGRVGDTPIIGAGTYADNRYCAISATGTGEYFIRGGLSRLVCDRMHYAGEDLQTAMDYSIHSELTGMGGDGGIIGVGANGQTAYSFNTEGMYRGTANSDGLRSIEIFGLTEEGR